MLTKAFETSQEHLTPADPDLTAIRKYALKQDIEAADVWCGRMKLCHDRVDRSHERFPKAYLDRFAATLPGKAVLGGHDYSSLPLGRFYDAAVVPDADGHHLKVSYYLPADSALIRPIELGVLKDVSIGFNAGKRLCDLCGKGWEYGHEHRPGGEYDGKTCTLTYCETEAHKAEAMEGSFVWMACQPGAEAVQMAAKEFSRVYTLGSGVTITLPFPPESEREESMTFKSIEEATAEVKRLQALPLAAEREAELQKAIALKEPLAKDGAMYRAWIKAETLRLAKAIDEANGTQVKTDQYQAILAHMEDAPAETLLAVLKGIQPEFDQKFAQGSGKTDSEPGTPPPARKSSPFGRFSMGGL